MAKQFPENTYPVSSIISGEPRTVVALATRTSITTVLDRFLFNLCP
jgi:hypothetical protein